MKSTDLPDFPSWLKWPEAIEQAPNRLGVYVFKFERSFGRFKGESDIVYVGCAAKETIKGRLRSHLPTNDSDIARRLRQMGYLQVAWKNLSTREEAEREEARLLRNYYREHLELPPVNRSEPGRVTRQLTEFLAQIAPNMSPEHVRKSAEGLVQRFKKRSRE